MPYLTNQYGNPHSKTHAYGWETEKAVETARKHIADLVGANAKDMVFTSGATESNNMCIKGVARFYKVSFSESERQAWAAISDEFPTLVHRRGKSTSSRHRRSTNASSIPAEYSRTKVST